MRRGFIVPLTKEDDNEKSGDGITERVLVKAEEAGRLESDIYRVEITFFQAQSRYLANDRNIPREDRGDLDNLIKKVFDGLGPIIGYRKKWTNVDSKGVPEDSNKPRDSAIVELIAKKVNSGSESEFVGVVIETL